METLLKFNRNGKWYYVLVDGKKYKYATYKDNTYDYNLDKDEINFMDEVMEMITPSDKRIKLMDYIYHGNTYQVLLDPKTDLRFFEPLPNKEDLSYLHQLFNNVEEYIYDTKHHFDFTKQLPKGMAKRILQIGKDLVVVYLSTALCVGAVFANYKIGVDVDYNNYVNSIETRKEMSEEEINEKINGAIFSNNHLSLAEKEKILECLPASLFIANKGTIDIDYLSVMLKSLNIVYTKANFFAWSGLYHNITNTLYFSGVSGLDEVDDMVFSHEVYHFIEHPNRFGYDEFLVETSNTIFNGEFKDKNDDNIYGYYYDMTKALMEIVGSEPIMQYHNYMNKEPIITALTNITGTKEDAQKLLANLSDYKKVYDKIIFEKVSYDEGWENLSNVYQQIFEQYEKYYFAKYDRALRDDLIMLYYLDRPTMMERLKELNGAHEETYYFVTNNLTYFNNANDGDKENGLVVSAGQLYETIYDPKMDTTYNKKYHYDTNTYTSTITEPDDNGGYHTYTQECDIDPYEGIKTSYVMTINDSNRYIDGNTLGNGRTA